MIIKKFINFFTRNEKGIALSSFVFFVFGFAVNYLITFITASYISSNEIVSSSYQYVSIAKNLSGYCLIITSAINAYLGRFISLAYMKDDIKKAKSYFNTGLFANIAISLFMIAVILPVIFNIGNILKIASDANVNHIQILFVCVLLNFLITTCVTSFSAFSIIANKQYVLAIIRVISYIFEALILIICFAFFKANIAYIGYSLLGFALLFAVLNLIACKKYTPSLKVSIKSFSFKDVKEILKNSIWSSINSLGNSLNTGLDVIFSNLYLSTVFSNLISSIKLIPTIGTTLVQTVSSVFLPNMVKKYAKNDIEGVKNIILNAITFSSFFGIFLCCFFSAFGGSFLNLWVSNYYSGNENIARIILIICSFGILVESFGYPICSIVTLTLKNKLVCLVTIMSGVTNILSMLLLLNFTNLGPLSVVITNAILTIPVYLVFIPLYLSKALGVSHKDFYFKFLKCLISFIVSLITTILISVFFKPDNWFSLIAAGIITLIINFITHFFFVSSQEQKNIIINFFKKYKDKILNFSFYFYVILVAWHFIFVSSMNLRLNAKVFWPAMAVIGLLLTCFKNGKLEVTLLDIWAVAFGFLFGLLSLFSVSVLNSLYGIAVLLIYYIVGRSIYFLGKNKFKQIMKIFLYACVFISLTIIIQAVFPDFFYEYLMRFFIDQEFWDFIVIQGNDGVLMGLTNSTGVTQVLVSTGLLLSYYFIFDERKILKKILYIIITIIMALILFLTSRRGSIVVVAIIIYFHLVTRKKIGLYIFFGVPTLIGILLLIGPEKIPFISSFWERIVESLISGDITTSRTDLWNMAFYLLNDRPLIGYGLNTYRIICGNYVHNSYIQSLFDYGYIFGPLFIIFVIAPFVFAIILYIKNRKKTLFDKANFLPLVMYGSFFFGLSFFESLFTENIYWLPFFIYLAFFYKNPIFSIEFSNKKIIFIKPKKEPSVEQITDYLEINI